MDMPQTQTQAEGKEVIARSRAQYRGVTILETQSGCVFFLGKLKYECLDLDEARSAIDAIYTVLAEKRSSGDS